MVDVVVLGASGMLGHAVARHLHNRGYEVHVSYSSEEQSSRNTRYKSSFVLDAKVQTQLNNIPDAEYVVNCIGAIPQKASYERRSMFDINARFPQLLARHCSRRFQKLIHVSTDCVYSGVRGGYVESDAHDSTDDYGISKSLGEPQNCMVIRTSLVGFELNSKFGLFSWAASQHSKAIDGYTNHFWNGVTNYQFAAICDKIIRDKLHVNGLRHVFSTKLSKHDMLVKLSNKFDLNLQVRKVDHLKVTIDRSLSTEHDLCSKLQVPDFDAMLRDLHDS